MLYRGVNDAHPPRAQTAYIALGSNLDDRHALIDEAIARVDATPGVRVAARSSIIETDPVGPGAQGAYLNAAIGVETTLGPEALLEALLAIEREMGRVRDEATRWGPRRIDLDILLYADRVVHADGEEALAVPHPRMHQRRFVLEPLAEIAPGALHPVLGVTVGELLGRLAPGGTTPLGGA